MIQNYIKQLLSLYNYIDAIVMVNDKGLIEYSDNFRPDINNVYSEEIVGRYIWDVYPGLNIKNSSLLQVLKDGRAILNEPQQLINFKGVEVKAVNSTFPIKSGNKIIGAVEVSVYVEPEKQRTDITLRLRERNEKKINSYDIDDIITTDDKMERIKKKILKISKTDSHVLIYGNTGTGKELIAQSIHRSSNRGSKPFISQNCAAIPHTLLESILFGTVKGSYTGAENRKGLFEAADGGTLFLDEINSMEMSMQAKLLKAIENQEIRRVGSTEVIKVNVRIVSAVNEPPLRSIIENRLREDLFYRIGVVQITLPDLKDRKDDIGLLSDYFIKNYNKRMGRKIQGISDAVRKVFKNYSWPGNVRELKNIIESAFNLTNENIIDIEDLPDYMFSGNQENHLEPEIILGEESLSEMVDKYERQIIEHAIKNSETITEAAKMLKISRQNLNYKLIKYDIKVK